MTARDALLRFIERELPERKKQVRASKLIARFVAEQVRLDRQRTAAQPPRSLFDIIFGERF